jgi:hypothetical protein
MVYTETMNILYDPPRPSMKIMTGDIVELRHFVTTRKLFTKVTQKKIMGYGVIVDFFYDGGYTAIVNVSGKIIKHSPEDVRLVQRVENRANELINEIEDFLRK